MLQFHCNVHDDFTKMPCGTCLQGRPKGTKNTSNHKAGSVRTGSGRKFWCEICTHKIDNNASANMSSNWFFSHDIVPETEKNEELLKTILN